MVCRDGGWGLQTSVHAEGGLVIEHCRGVTITNYIPIVDALPCSDLFIGCLSHKIVSNARWTTFPESRNLN